MSTKPDFVNEQGSKWWKHKGLNDWAAEKNLSNVTCWLVEAISGQKEYVILKGKDYEYASASMEHALAHLDFMFLQEAL